MKLKEMGRVDEWEAKQKGKKTGDFQDRATAEAKEITETESQILGQARLEA